MTTAQIDTMLTMRRDSATIAAIAAALSCNERTVWKHLARKGCPRLSRRGRLEQALALRAQGMADSDIARTVGYADSDSMKAVLRKDRWRMARGSTAGDRWVFLFDLTALCGATIDALNSRVHDRGIPHRRAVYPGCDAHRKQIRECDVPRLAGTPRAKRVGQPRKARPIPEGSVRLSHVAEEYAFPTDSLKRRALAWGIPLTKIGKYLFVSRDDVPRLIDNPVSVRSGAVYELPTDTPLPTTNVQDGGGYLVRAVAARFGIDPARVYGRDRTGQVAIVRHIAAAVLHRVGMTITKIAQHLNRDHGTIANSLARVKADTSLSAYVAHMVARHPTGNTHADFDNLLPPLVQQRHPQDGATILAYLRADILHLTTIRPDHGARALFALAGDPVLVIKLTHLLRTHGQQGAAGVLESRVNALRKVAR